MMRHCGKCNYDFDDEFHLTLCPHVVGDRAQLAGANPTMDTLDELVSVEMVDLLFPPYVLTRES